MGATLAALLAALPLQPTVAQASKRSFRADTIPVDAVRPGMKGYGLTVFEGTRPERFGVEVIDVIKNFRPNQDAILVKTMHPRLDVVNVVRGMSGSPIFLEGKMAGAYAYGWAFGKEPVAGVTPISDMLEDLERPLPQSIHGFPLQLLPAAPAVGRAPQARWDGGSGRFQGNPGSYSVTAHAQQLRGQAGSRGTAQGGLQPVATPILLGGVGEAAFGLAQQLLQPLGLEPVQGGGGSGTPDASTPSHYEDGGAIGVQLVRGDIGATGLGTVTRVEGDRLVGFGHPMLNAGVTALPTAIARVTWVLASEASSFKLGTAVRPLGAMINDRQASIVVSESASAPLIPVEFEVDGVPGAPHGHWSFEIAHEKFMAPSLLAMALGNALEATGAERQDVSWSAVSTLKVRGYPAVKIEDFGVSVGGTPDQEEFGNSNLVSAVGAVVNNPWEPAFIESVKMKIQLRYAREIVRLRGARALDAEVDAGGTARVALTLLPFHGAPIERMITVPMPPHLAGSSVKLTILPGHSVPREQAAPETLAEFISNLENPIYPPKSIVVSYQQGTGMAFKGRVAENLPPGALDRLRLRSNSIAPEPFQSKSHHVVQLNDFMIGAATVDVQVKAVLR
jgi:hypothetical protein